MNERRTASYVTAPTYLGLRVAGQVLGPIPPAQAPPPALCRCADPHAVIVSTGPVLCSACGRRLG